VEEILPLSPLQEGLLFHALYDASARDVYTVQLVLGLEGHLEEETLQAAATALLRRHGNLRASFLHEELVHPVQVILSEVEVPWRKFDLRRLSAERTSAAMGADTQRGCAGALRSGQSSAASLHAGADGRAEVPVVCSAITTCYWMAGSMPVVLRELFVLYAQRGSDRGLEPVDTVPGVSGMAVAAGQASGGAEWERGTIGIGRGNSSIANGRV